MSETEATASQSRSKMGLLVLTILLAAGLFGIGYMVITAAGPGGASLATSGGSSKSPSGSSEAMKRPIDTINMAVQAADEYMRQGQYVNAGVIMDRAVAKFPEDQQLRQMYAAALLGQGRHADALAQMEVALKAGPQPAKAYFDAAVLASQAKKPERAAELFTMAMQKDPTDPQFPLFLAMVQVKLGQDAPAAASLARALKLKQDLPEAWGTLAELALKENQLELASEQVQRAREMQPDSVRWRNVQAKILKRQGKAEEAVALLQAFDGATLADNGALYTLADSLGMLSKPLAAARVIANAAVAKQRDGELYYQAAIWFQRGGDTAMATSNAEMAKELGFEKAKELLAQLKK